MNHLIKYKLFEAKKRVHRNKDVQRAIKIVQEHGVGVRFIDTGDLVSGGADIPKGYIEIGLDLTKPNIIISTLFHELGHFYCYDKNIYKEFHHGFFRTDITEEQFKSMLRTAIKAERYVDEWAKKKMKEHFPHLRFTYTYRAKNSKKWVNDYLYSSFEKPIIDMETRKLIKLLEDI